MRNTTNTARFGIRQNLSVRQFETLRLIAEGYTTRQIAACLSITKKTVEKHRQTLMKKLKIHQIATLTRYAVSIGVVKVNWNPLNGSPGHSHGRAQAARKRAASRSEQEAQVSN